MKKLLGIMLRVLPAVILLQTLRYKFLGDPLSIHIFSTLGVEPWGRYLSGVVELVAGILLIMPSRAVIGAILGAGVMSGAIVSHLFFLGIDVQGDGGALFRLAVIVFVCCLVIVFKEKDKLKDYLPK